MPFLKSNSALIALDESVFSSSEAFNFLSFIQSISFDVKTNRINAKHLGSSTSITEQFTQPEINLNLSFYQSKNFFNEIFFGLNFAAVEEDTEYVFKNILQNDFFNKNSFILFNNLQGNDLIYSSLNQEMTSISIGNLYLSNYSFSYRLNELPVVNTSFVSDNLKLSTLSNLLKLRNWDDSEIQLNNVLFENLKSDAPNAESLVYVMNGLQYSTDFSTKSYSIGVNLNSLLEGIIQSIDLSIDLNRSKMYFLNGKNSVSNRKVLMPINSSLKISGISYILNPGNIKNFFDNNSNFYLKIDALDEVGQVSCSFIYENLKIESFSYSVNLNGFLEYSLECSFQITDDSGFKIIKTGKPTKNFSLIQSSDLKDLKSSDGYFLYVKNY